MNPLLLLVVLVTGFWAGALVLDRAWEHAPAARRHALLAAALMLGALLPLGLLAARSGLLPRWPLPLAAQARGEASPPEESSPSSTREPQAIGGSPSFSLTSSPLVPPEIAAASPALPGSGIILDGKSGRRPAAADRAPAPASWSWLPHASDALLIAWLAGSVIALALLARRLLALRRWRRALLTAPTLSWDAEMAAQVQRRTGLRRLPELRQDPNLAVPALLGWRRPLLVLPADPALLTDTPRLRQVLLHECAHAARSDAAWALLAALAQAVWWWHPLLHRLVRRLELAREECCDALALAEADPDAVRGYAATLLTYAARPAGPALAPALSGTELEHRLDHLLKGREAMSRHPRIVAALAVLPLAICAVLGFGLVAAEPEENPEGSASDPVAPSSVDPRAGVDELRQELLLAELRALRTEQAALRQQLAAAHAAKDAKIQELEDRLSRSDQRRDELNQIAQDAQAVAFQLNAKLAEVEHALKQPEALSLHLPSEVVELTIVQRHAQPIPGSLDRIRVHLGDITAGQVELAIRDERGTALLESRSMHVGATASFTIAGKEFHVGLRELRNALVGGDVAEVLVASRVLTASDLARRTGVPPRMVRVAVGSDGNRYCILLEGRVLTASLVDSEGPEVWKRILPAQLEDAAGTAVPALQVQGDAVIVRGGSDGQFAVDLLTGRTRAAAPLAEPTVAEEEEDAEKAETGQETWTLAEGGIAQVPLPAYGVCLQANGLRLAAYRLFHNTDGKVPPTPLWQCELPSTSTDAAGIRALRVRRDGMVVECILGKHTRVTIALDTGRLVSSATD